MENKNSPNILVRNLLSSLFESSPICPFPPSAPPTHPKARLASWPLGRQSGVMAAALQINPQLFSTIY